MEQSSSSVQYQPFQLYLLRSEFEFDQLHQNDGEEDARTERRRQDCGKIKANSDEPGRDCLDSSSVNSPIASKSLGTLKASSGKPDARARRNSKPDAASSSQGWLKDAHV